MARSTPESVVSKAVIEYLDKLMDGGAPIYYEHRSGSGGFSYKKGVPDLWITVNGIHVEVELKSSKGKLSTMQEKFKWRCENIFKCMYWNPYGFVEFKFLLDRLLYQTTNKKDLLGSDT